MATPQDLFQYGGIYYAAFNDDTFLVINRGTADGKTLVPQTTALLCGGVTVILEPLILLGSNHVEKATVLKHDVVAYHVDEHKKEDANRLREFLLNLTDDVLENKVVHLILGPSEMISTAWRPTLEMLSKRGHISFFCIDEVREVEQSGRSFCPDFQKAVRLIPELIQLMPCPVPKIAMSATLTDKDIHTITHLLGDMKPNILSGPLHRRKIKFTCHISGDKSKSLKESAEVALSMAPYAQHIWFTHSKTNAEGGLLVSAQNMLEAHQQADRSV